MTRQRDDDPADVQVGPPATSAAGVRGVVEAGRIALRQMGPVRSARTLLRVNQPGGFDCPGCAWPEDAERGHLELCENGAKAVAEEATTARVTRAFFAAHDLVDLAGRDEHWLGQQGRLTEPMVKRAGASHYEPISWDDAFGLVGDELRALGSPDQAAFYTSGRTSNEAAFLYQLFVRAYGTNNLPDCSNLCHESSGLALTETIGIGKGSVTLDDVRDTDLVIVVGQNPGTNHPRMLTALEAAKRNGARIVAVNPLPEAGLIRFKHPQRVRGVVGKGTALADRFVQVKVNGDLALFLALDKWLVEADALDHTFLAEYCDGLDELRAHLATLDWDDLLAAAGITRGELDELAELVCASPRIIVTWAMGLTQHRNAVATIREVMNFLLLRGNIGRQGAGACPVRGHSNVQGDRTMGITERPAAAFLGALGAAAGFEPPAGHGRDVVDTIRGMRDGDVSVFVGMGGNFLSASPDTTVTAAALRRCRLTVHVATKLNRSHVVTGETALLLPCLGRTERDRQAGGDQVVTVEDSMGLVHASRGRLAPASADLRSEVAIVAGLASATLGPTTPVDWAALAADYAGIRSLVEQVVPGFEHFEARIAEPVGFALPHAPRDQRQFPTATGKARLTVNPLTSVEVSEGRLLLQTVRSHDQYNTTIYGLDDRYRGITGGRHVVFAHVDDLAAAGLADGDLVTIVGEHGGVERRAERFRAVAYPTPPGTCAAYFPEANVLVPLDSTAEGSNTPTSKSVVVRLERWAP